MMPASRDQDERTLSYLALRDSGELCRDIGFRFGVSQQSVSAVTLAIAKADLAHDAASAGAYPWA